MAVCIATGCSLNHVEPPEVEYALSDERRSLEPFLLGLSVWSEKWLTAGGMKIAEPSPKAIARSLEPVLAGSDVVDSTVAST